MKRLMLLATVMVFASCSPKADEIVPADAAMPTSTDSAQADTVPADTVPADSTAMDTSRTP